MIDVSFSKRNRETCSMNSFHHGIERKTRVAALRNLNLISAVFLKFARRLENRTFFV